MPSPVVIGAAVAVLIVIVLVVVFSSGPKVPSAAELAAMDATAIAAIAPNVLKKIAAADLAALSETQKGALIEKQVAALTTAQVDALVLTFTPQQWNFLTRKQLEGILETQIQALPNSVVTALLDEKLRAVAPKLKQAQIEALDATKVDVIADLMTETQVGFVSNSTLAALGREGFRGIASKLSVEKFLNSTTVENLNRRLIYCTQAQTQALNMEFFQTLGYSPTAYYIMGTFLQKSTVAKVAWIDTSMINSTLCEYVALNASNYYAADVQEAFVERCRQGGML